MSPRKKPRVVPPRYDQILRMIIRAEQQLDAAKDFLAFAKVAIASNIQLEAEAAKKASEKKS